MSCRGTNLRDLILTGDERETGRTVLALAVGDALRHGDRLVGGEVAHVVGGGRAGGGGRFEELGRRHEGVAGVGLSLDEDGAYSSILGCLAQDGAHQR